MSHTIGLLSIQIEKYEKTEVFYWLMLTRLRFSTAGLRFSTGRPLTSDIDRRRCRRPIFLMFSSHPKLVLYRALSNILENEADVLFRSDLNVIWSFTSKTVALLDFLKLKQRNIKCFLPFYVHCIESTSWKGKPSSYLILSLSLSPLIFSLFYSSDFHHHTSFYPFILSSSASVSANVISYIL